MTPASNNLPLGKLALLAGAIFLLIVLESGFFGRVGFLPMAPQLVLLLLACLFTFDGRVEYSVAVALIGGIMGDYVSGLPDGVILLAFIASYFALIGFNRSFLAVKASPLVTFGINTLMLTGLNFFLVCLFSYLFSLANLGSSSDFRYESIHLLPWLALINLLAGYLMAWLYTAIKSHRLFGFKKV